MISRRLFSRLATAAGLCPAVPRRLGLQRAYSAQVPQNALVSGSILNFVDPGELRKFYSDLCCSP